MNATGPPRPRRPRTLGWLLVTAAAFLVFELTASPVFTVLVGCFKFGWDDLAAARWVARRHPDPQRARLLSRWLETYGLWKISLVAFGVVAALVAIRGVARGQRGKAPRDLAEAELITATLVWITGWLLFSLMSSLATRRARREGIRVWVGGKTNRAGLIAWGGLFKWLLLAIALSGLYFIGLGHLFKFLALYFKQDGEGLYLWLVMSAQVPWALALLGDWFRDANTREQDDPLLARDPRECWDVAWLTRARSRRPPDPLLGPIDDFQGG